MTPAQAIASLDSQLAAHGELVTLRRYTAPTGTPRPKTELSDVQAFVRPVKPDDLVGDIKQTDLKVIVSPTSSASLLPFKIGDKVLIAGAEKNVEFAGHIRLRNQIVRIELMVRG